MRVSILSELIRRSYVPGGKSDVSDSAASELVSDTPSELRVPSGRVCVGFAGAGPRWGALIDRRNAVRRRLLVPLIVIVAGVGLAGPAWADNPHSPSGFPTGRPSQSCQSFAPNIRPGNAANSPGSPFNEPGINSTDGGKGGLHYSTNAQYDVACFQQSVH